MPAASKKRSRDAVQSGSSTHVAAGTQAKRRNKGEPMPAAAKVDTNEAIQAEGRQLWADAHQELRSFALKQKEAKQQGKDTQATRSYQAAAEDRKMQARQADTELQNRKQQIYGKLWRQYKDIDARGRSSGKSFKTKSKPSDGVKAVQCTCGEARVFCKYPTCMALYCEVCAVGLEQKPAFRFCECESDHECRRHPAKGPFCKKHYGKYLVTCTGCKLTACKLAKCEECQANFCQEHLDKEEDLCENCRHELTVKLLDCGVVFNSDREY